MDQSEDATKTDPKRKLNADIFVPPIILLWFFNRISHDPKGKSFDRVDGVLLIEKIKERIESLSQDFPPDREGRISEWMELIHSADIFPWELMPAIAIVSTSCFYQMKGEWFRKVIYLLFSMTEIVFEWPRIAHILCSISIIMEVSCIPKYEWGMDRIIIRLSYEVLKILFIRFIIHDRIRATSSIFPMVFEKIDLLF